MQGDEGRESRPLDAELPADAVSPDEPIERVLLAVLGHCVSFNSADERIIEMARGRYAPWMERDPDAVASRLRVLVSVDHFGGTSRPGVERIVRLGRVTIPLRLNAPNATAFLVPRDRAGIARVHPMLLAQRQLFEEEVMDAVVLALVAQFDRHPVHAATIARDGQAVILYGASGAGKSTLAWMAHSAGLSVLSDDRAWIQLQPELRLWTERPRVRLHPNAMQHFPAADRARVAIDATRGDKFVATLDAGAEARAPIARVTPCLLARSASHATLERIGSDTVIDALSRDVPAGFDRFPSRHAEVVANLAAAGGWRLALSADPWEALPHLHTMLDASV